jgi:hypothetical protein
MSDIFEKESLSPESLERQESFEEDIRAAKERILKSVPEDIANLGTLLRRSLATGDLSEFIAFLENRNMHFEENRVEHLRDLIIVQRFDLKEFEPAARERLRARTLLVDDVSMMTADYSQAVASGSVPSCRDCQYFVTAPKDGTTEGDDKACVEFGTKGADQACVGFRFKES